MASRLASGTSIEDDVLTLERVIERSVIPHDVGSARLDDDEYKRGLAARLHAGTLDDEGRRILLLYMAVTNPHIFHDAFYPVRRATPDAGRREAIRSEVLRLVTNKILAISPCRKPLDLGQIAGGSSFTGWCYNSVVSIAKHLLDHPLTHKQTEKARVETSLDVLLEDVDDDGWGVPESAITAHDVPVMTEPRLPILPERVRRPTGVLLRSVETLPAREALKVLRRNGWPVADGADEDTEAGVAGILTPRLSDYETAMLDDRYAGMGSVIRACDEKADDELLWLSLRATARFGEPVMNVWERISRDLAVARLG